MDLGEVLSSSWKVFWNRKLLWLFGIVPILIYMIPAVGMVLFVFRPDFLNSNSNSFFSYGILILDGVYVLLMIAYMFLYVFTDVSIVKGTLLFDQKGEKPGASELMKQSLPYYWRVFGMYAIFFGAYFITISIMVAIIMVATIATLGIGVLCMFPLLILYIPVAYLAISFLELSRTSIIQDNIGIGECFKRTWALFKEKFWKIVLVAVVIYFGMGVVMSILFIPLYGVLFIPFFNSVAQIPLNSQTPINPQDFIPQFFSSMRWAYAIFIPIFSLVSGILNTFIREVWAVAYMRWSRKPAAAALPPSAPLEPALGVQ
jgi:hypothetical protein